MHVMTPMVVGLGQTRRCLRWRARRPGDATEGEFVCAEWEPPPPTTPPSTTTPTINCQNELSRWGYEHMQLARCVTEPEDFDYWDTLCSQVQRGRITLATARNRFTQYMQRRCAPPTPPPPVQEEPPHPPPPTTPPEMPPGIPDPGETPGGDEPLLEPPPEDTNDGATPDGGPTQRDWRRRFGPIVGVGLLAAVGLTVYRVKRKPRRR